MGAFTGFLMVAGVMTLFGSALALGLTFLHSVQGDPWAPMSTGAFVTHYGVNLGVEDLFGWLGWGGIYQAIMSEPVYRSMFILGILLIVFALVARSMNREA
jgi:hypothetical protein